MLPLHSFASQVSSSTSSGQAAPPCFASWATPLDLDLLVLAPLLVQITLHLLHDDQSSTLQSTEPSHWSLSQSFTSSKAGQAVPPFSASWTTPFPLVLVPPPQVALQSDHDDQSSILQSTEETRNYFVGMKNNLGIGSKMQPYFNKFLLAVDWIWGCARSGEQRNPRRGCSQVFNPYWKWWRLRGAVQQRIKW